MVEAQTARCECVSAGKSGRGARIFNASHPSGVPVREYAKQVDSLMFCLSKGLSAPAGSMLVANTERIAFGRRLRKALGGGMRQVGVLAAPGIIALTEMVGRLKEDHARAKALARGISGLPGIRLEPASSKRTSSSSASSTR